MAIETFYLILFSFDIGLIILIYTYNTQGVINRFFSLMMIPITLTNLEMLLLHTAQNNVPVQIGFNMAVWGMTFFYPLFYHFTFYFPRKDRKQKPTALLIFLYGVPLLFGILHLINSNPEQILFPFDEFLQQTALFKANLLYYITQILVFAYITILLIFTTRRLILALKKPILPREQKAVLMVLVGFVPLSLILLTMAVLFIPFRGGLIIYLIASIIYSFYFILLIFQFGFFEGKTFVKVFIIYPTYIAFMVILYMTFFKRVNLFIADLFNISATLLLSLEIGALFFIISPLIRLLERKLGNAVIPVSSDIHSGIKNTQNRLIQVIDLNELNLLLEKIFVNEMNLRNFFLLLEDNHAQSYHTMSAPRERDYISFDYKGELVRKLRAERKILNIQNIRLFWSGGTELEILDNNKISLVLPLFVGKKLIGICLLGELGVLRTWHHPEIEEVELFGAQLSIVIERCKTHAAAIEMEQKQARIEKFAAMSEITSGVAHEIRNPMSIISTSAETIATKDLPEEELKIFARYIQEETSRVSKLLNRILSIAPQKSDMENISTDVSIVVNHTFDLISARARKKSIYLTIDSSKESCIALIDKEALTQVCLNIVLNALEATPQFGYIKAEIHKNSYNEIEILFINSGQQIPEDLRKKIFDPFVTTKDQGTGLGLPVSMRLIKNAGGKLRLLNTEGKTVFQVLLPASTE